MSETPSVPRWAREAGLACEELLARCTVAIVTGESKPERLGSGVLLAIGLDWIVLTAAHVLRPAVAQAHRLGIIQASGVVMLPNTGIVTTTGADDDLIDAAVVLLEPAHRDQLEAAGFEPIRQGRIANATAAGQHFLMAGYPRGLFTADGSRGSVTPAMLGTFESQAEIPMYDPARHLRLAYPTSETVAFADAESATYFTPHGFSGAGVWAIAQGARGWSADEARLVAIETAWLDPVPAIRCTRIETHVELLVRSDPETGRGFGRALDIMQIPGEQFPHVWRVALAR